MQKREGRGLHMATPALLPVNALPYLRLIPIGWGTQITTVAGRISGVHPSHLLKLLPYQLRHCRQQFGGHLARLGTDTVRVCSWAYSLLSGDPPIDREARWRGLTDNQI